LLHGRLEEEEWEVGVSVSSHVGGNDGCEYLLVGLLLSGKHVDDSFSHVGCGDWDGNVEVVGGYLDWVPGGSE